MGFEWSAPAARFEIFGVPCEVEIGDAGLFDRLQAAADKMTAFDYAKTSSDGKAGMAMSAELRGVIRSVIGHEAAEKVFKGRKPNIIMETSMLAYVFEQVNDAAAASNEAVQDSVARIAALSRPIGAEE